MAGDANETRHLADAGMGGISSVVATLPGGYTLGEARVVNGKKYKLVHNAGTTQISIGICASPVAITGSSPNSVTVSTASQGFHHIGAVLCEHVTATTATYFWGLVRGATSGQVGDSASLPTGSVFALGDNGSIQVFPQSVVTGKAAVGYVITTVSNGGARSGSTFVQFE